MKTLLLSFWGDFDEKAPSRSERKAKLVKYLNDFYDKNTKSLIFKVGSQSICESTWLYMMCLSNSSQWKKVKSEVLDPEKHERDMLVQAFSKVKLQRKSEHAEAFIHLVASSYSDFSFELAQHAETQTKIVPFDDISEFYSLYCAHYNRFGQKEPVAKRETFRLVYNRLSDSGVCRLRGGKGSFETCAVCNNINDALKNSKLKWTQNQLVMVLKLKQLHLAQQAEERKDSQRRREQAATTFNDTGNYLFHFSCSLMFT